MDERSKQEYTKYYDIVKLIGKGAFGCVYKGKKKKKKEYRAIKIMNLQRIIKNILYQHQAIDIFKYLELLKNLKI